VTAETPVTGGEELDASRMPLLDHLIELRSRLLKSVLALALAFGVCF
jgi:sec-independent protein translocase protein TatC